MPNAVYMGGGVSEMKRADELSLSRHYYDKLFYALWLKKI
jgi:hypothetical protein